MYRSLLQDTHPFCTHSSHSLIHSFSSPPEGETPLNTSSSPYLRHLVICDTCQHVQNLHAFDFSNLYESSYWESTYHTKKNTSTLTTRFQQILSLEPSKSDNRGRVARILRFFHNNNLPKTLLDIGAGLAVFSALMKQNHWHTSIIDPNPLAISHALSHHATDNALCASFPTPHEILQKNLPSPFSLITLNKVLEHTPDPVLFLSHVLPLLHPQAIVYIEVPDAQAALLSPLAHFRQEFFLEHFHAFSFPSLLSLITLSGFFPLSLERIQEPSGKYTLYAFITPQPSNTS